MAFKDLHKYAKGFDKNPQNINKKGQPRKLISDVNIDLENDGVKEAKKTDIVSCYLRLINLPIDELKQAVEDNKKPALIRIVGKAILSGKGFEVIEKVLDRAVGKANNEIKEEIKLPEIKIEVSTPEMSEVMKKAIETLNKK